MLDEISANIKQNNLNFSNLYIDKNSNLKILFRQRKKSQKYVPKLINELLEKNNKNQTIITATDAELYGLKHNDLSYNFEKLLKSREIKTLTASEYLKNLKQTQKISLRASSWESTKKQLKNNLPYFLWYNKKNKIQIFLWKLVDLAIKNVNKNTKDRNYFWSRQHLDRGLASCTFWWASGHDFKLFGPISWNPDEIEKGTNELIKSIRSLANPKTKTIKIQAEKLYIKIKSLIWHKHWNNYWEK